jgi:ribosomal protein L11 methyltransferase
LRHYKEFLLTIDPFIPEVVQGLLWELDIAGINEEINSLRIYAEEDSTVNPESFNNLMEKLKSEGLVREYSLESYLVEDRNWNEEWEKNVQIIKITDNIIIKPTFRKYEEREGDIVITIDPKMSFGTGDHATTKLCVEMIERYIKPEMNILDVGSGTGILAIAAIKLGGEKAIAVDNDEWCYENGKENGALNGIDEKIDFRIGEIKDIPEKGFDLILANIQKNVLLHIKDELELRLKKGGILILSGILYSDEAEIVGKYTPPLKLKDVNKMEEWIAISFEK